MARKLKYRWLNPYYIINIDLEKSVYKLIELNKVKLNRIFISQRLKEFIKNPNDK